EGRPSPIGRGSEHPPPRRGESRALARRRKSALPCREEGGPSMLRKLALVALTCAAAPAFAAGDSRVKIAVLDLQARGVDAGLVQSAGTLIASELNKLEVFKVISREDIRNMLSFEKDKQNLGCEADQACLAEIGGALGVEYIIAGSLAKI